MPQTPIYLSIPNPFSIPLPKPRIITFPVLSMISRPSIYRPPKLICPQLPASIPTPIPLHAAFTVPSGYPQSYHSAHPAAHHPVHPPPRHPPPRHPSPHHPAPGYPAACHPSAGHPFASHYFAGHPIAGFGPAAGFGPSGEIPLVVAVAVPLVGVLAVLVLAVLMLVLYSLLPFCPTPSSSIVIHLAIGLFDVGCSDLMSFGYPQDWPYRVDLRIIFHAIKHSTPIEYLPVKYSCKNPSVAFCKAFVASTWAVTTSTWSFLNVILYSAFTSWIICQHSLRNDNHGIIKLESFW